MFKIYVDPEPPVANEGCVLCVDSKTPNELACLMSRTEIAKRGVVFKIYDEPV